MENASSEFQGTGLERLGVGSAKPSGGTCTHGLLGDLQEEQRGATAFSPVRIVETRHLWTHLGIRVRSPRAEGTARVESPPDRPGGSVEPPVLSTQ